MKKYFKQTLVKIGLVSIIVFGIIYCKNDYMEFKVRKCIVIDKMATIGGYRSSSDFYLILKEERGIEFDLTVSPTTFSQSKVGDVKYFNLRQLDIKQTPINNAIYFISYITFGVIGFVCLFFGWIFLIFYPDDNNWRF